MKQTLLYLCLGFLGLALVGSAFAAYRNAERLTINDPVGEDLQQLWRNYRRLE